MSREVTEQEVTELCTLIDAHDPEQRHMVLTSMRQEIPECCITFLVKIWYPMGVVSSNIDLKAEESGDEDYIPTDSEQVIEDASSAYMRIIVPGLGKLTHMYCPACALKRIRARIAAGVSPAWHLIDDEAPIFNPEDN